METQRHEEITGATREQEIETLKKELDKEHDLYLRALADFDNYRKRTERERSYLGREGKRALMLSVLEILDDLDRSLDFSEGEKASLFADGIRSIRQKLLRLLEKEGVRPVECVGQPFDPSIHEATTTLPSEELEPGTVLQEIRRGYRWDDDLLRTARVVVSQ